MTATWEASEADPLPGFLRSLERFLAAHVDAQAIDRAHRIPPGVLSGLADLGVFGVSLPAAHGGSELGLVGATAVVECLARADRAVATTVGLHLGLGTRGLVAFGSESQQRAFLPELASGRAIAAFATTEPGAGSDLSRLATTATQAPDGRIQVQGQKAYVTNGGLADVFTITAATPGMGGALGQSLVLLRRSDGGIELGREEDKLGLRGSSTVPVFIDAMVPADRIVGEAGAGGRMLGPILAWGRTIMAAGCAGTARAALDKTLAHVRTRHQFGRALGQNLVVRQQIAAMGAELFAMRALIRRAAEGGATLERRSLAAKVYASEADWRICDLALQLHGGHGYIEESGVPLLLRDARITRIFEGANDVLLGRLGLLAFATPGEVPADRGGDLAHAAGDPRAAQIAEQLAHTCKALHARRGLATLRDPIALHHLGRLVVIAEAAAAVAARPTTDLLDQALADHALNLLVRSAAEAATAPVTCAATAGTATLPQLLIDRDGANA